MLSPSMYINSVNSSCRFVILIVQIIQRGTLPVSFNLRKFYSVYRQLSQMIFMMHCVQCLSSAQFLRESTSCQNCFVCTFLSHLQQFLCSYLRS